MIPWSLVAASPIPGGRGEIRLMRRGSEFSIVLGTIELMNNRLSGSEKALAVRTCERLEDRARPNLLIGGLGMGFTLRAVLSEVGPEARITVSELVPAVVEWAHGSMAEIFRGSLGDPRVRIVEGDVAALIGSSTGLYDAILLDVDNGPSGLTRASNDGLYGAAGLAAARRALKPAGILSVWSARPDGVFAARMRRAGFAVDQVRVRARGNRGARHVLWIGQRD
jgi:spermidine synthase